MITHETERTLRAESIARSALEWECRVAVAESLTGGMLASSLSRAPDASTWFLGGVVAYTLTTKVRALGVTPGPVVTERCAREMADGVRSLLGADVSIAVTGVGGPGPDEGEPAGTVYLSASSALGTRAHREQFAGTPEEVTLQTIDAALMLLASAIHDLHDTERRG